MSLSKHDNLISPTRMAIKAGREYIYIAQDPKGCRGHRYKVVCFIKQVPTYQVQVLVEALTGPDAGQKFCCTPANFMTRYISAEPEVKPEHYEAPLPFVDSHPAGRAFTGSGV